MTRASVRNLRYNFRRIERLLRQGEEIQITSRRQVIARIIPETEKSTTALSDFLGRLRATYGDKLLLLPEQGLSQKTGGGIEGLRRYQLSDLDA